ncbi:hypothetical protein Ae168Ps1_3663 [Pseudonocardia sp. Ae168_Ps1]|nr:hypothetical protein Ae150APs1_3641 [Pseudonocardia sp. Ae150A_Ps1]OLL81257.1 hypothetical protein Ae168Ps1_3663 [Pseudonocardia sp. Ae168_Ps1]OLL84628.1 hypothetical protein Ae263Ps1_1683c [Pseudonocardia sp. Ae263_Ps1]OLL95355.1 hypothetical protein Ae356Ps1_5252 [Pseudonocardia sp. Ae356_Ps1]
MADLRRSRIAGRRRCPAGRSCRRTRFAPVEWFPHRQRRVSGGLSGAVLDRSVHYD